MWSYQKTDLNIQEIIKHYSNMTHKLIIKTMIILIEWGVDCRQMQEQLLAALMAELQMQKIHNTIVLQLCEMRWKWDENENENESYEIYEIYEIGDCAQLPNYWIWKGQTVETYVI